jgi:hypothetical protein
MPNEIQIPNPSTSLRTGRTGRENSGLIVNKPNIQIFPWGLIHRYIDPERLAFENLDLEFLRNPQLGILVSEPVLPRTKP